jgi:hypothetical protein
MHTHEVGLLPDLPCRKYANHLVRNVVRESIRPKRQMLRSGEALPNTAISHYWNHWTADDI